MKTTNKKLNLKRDTIQNLNTRQLGAVVGGCTDSNCTPNLTIIRIG
jgi:hypothetical protein